MKRSAGTFAQFMKPVKTAVPAGSAMPIPSADGSVPAMQPDFEAMAARWLASMGASQGTKKNYGRIAKSFFRWLRNRGTTAPDREDVLAWFEWLKQTYAAPTVNFYMSAVRGFFVWANQAELYPDIAGDIVVPSSVTAPRKDALTAEQARTLLESVDKSTEADLRDYAILTVMLTTGLRCFSLVSISEDDLKQDAEGASIHCYENGKPVIARIAPPVLNSIRAWLEARRYACRDSVGMPLFTSLSHRNFGGRLSSWALRCIIKERFDRAGIYFDRLTMQTPRYAAATLGLQGGGTAAGVDSSDGHGQPAIAARHEMQSLPAEAHMETEAPEVQTRHADAPAEAQSAPAASATRFLPPKREKTRMINVTMRLTPGAKAKAARLAQSRGMSLSEFCAAVIDNVVRDAQGESFDAA